MEPNAQDPMIIFKNILLLMQMELMEEVEMAIEARSKTS
jgi:hypothetical protein